VENRLGVSVRRGYSLEDLEGKVALTEVLERFSRPILTTLGQNRYQVLMESSSNTDHQIRRH
jgi:hypothetical protein